MLVCVQRLVELNPALDRRGRELLEAAYCHLSTPRRHTCRALAALMQQADPKGNDRQSSVTLDLRWVLRRELAEICRDALSLLDEFLLPSAQDTEAMIFFLKMEGDYHRYFAETLSGAGEEGQKTRALEAYTKAHNLAVETLDPRHPLRLGVALNFSVFYYESLKSPDRSCTLAKQAFDEAVQQGGGPREEPPARESALIMSLLRNNLTLWTSEAHDSKQGLP
eukprot:GGOE01019443.1.p1 GENE.GGOE01019443.1~~GGOE01019443.1.p1  ORF type:complete len:223 (-),score=58.82 GGOE01019443.1:67-735(-)